MKFAQWFTEMDQTQLGPLPDAKEFSYVACVLTWDSQQHLEAFAAQWVKDNTEIVIGHWRWRSHHMTVLPPGQVHIDSMEKYRPYFGEWITLTVTHIAINKDIMAVVVSPNPSFPINQKPHVTVAHGAVSPKESNTLLMDNDKIYHVDSFTLQSAFAAVRTDQKTIWPAKNIKMATP